MTRDEIATLYRYNTWANARILDTAARLTTEQFQAVRGGSFDSVKDTLVHTMSAHWLWLERWNGRSPRTMIAPDGFRDVGAIRTRWDGIERDTYAFLGGLTEDRLATVIAYTNMKGERWAYPLWQQMMHLVNHGTQHRSEAAVMLTLFGHSPGELDLLHYVDAHASRA
jgi:uncharacterized damage-inducible protein DinB